MYVPANIMWPYKDCLIYAKKFANMLKLGAYGLWTHTSHGQTDNGLVDIYPGASTRWASIQRSHNVVIWSLNWYTTLVYRIKIWLSKTFLCYSRTNCTRAHLLYEVMNSLFSTRYRLVWLYSAHLKYSEQVTRSKIINVSVQKPEYL